MAKKRNRRKRPFSIGFEFLDKPSGNHWLHQEAHLVDKELLKLVYRARIEEQKGAGSREKSQKRPLAARRAPDSEIYFFIIEWPKFYVSSPFAGAWV